MALGAGEGTQELRKETASTLVVRPARVLNRFDYIEARTDDPTPTHSDPGGLSPLAAIQPAVPITRAEKERVKCAVEYVRTIADHNNPPPPLRPKVSWPQSRAESPWFLTTAYSRTELLSQRIAAQGG